MVQIVFRTMSTILVPPGWIRKRVDKRIVYVSDPPRVHIWKIKDFDVLKKKGRFPTVNRETLNFSTKVRVLYGLKVLPPILKWF